MGKRRSCLVIIGLIALIGLVGAAAIISMALIDVQPGLSMLERTYLQFQLAGREAALNTPASADTTLQIFVVAPGDNAGVIGGNLVQQGLILDSELFQLYARLEGLDNRLEAGTYFLSPAQPIPNIALALTDSSAASITVQVIEGWRREEIAAAIDATPLLQFTGADFLTATDPGAVTPPGFADYVGLPAGASLEGFLYPDTYFLPPDATAADLRDTLLNTFVERVDSSLATAAANARLSLYDVVTLAAIVEREAVIPEEQPLIASVYLNRLAIDMTLDADPTVQYGLNARGGAWWPSITQADYRTAVSPYNTYLNPGLPPGPIANPSMTAIQAVIFPAESTYYFFRADCEGSGYHVFAVTFDEHVANGYCP
jgi:UPF0755 protein